MFPHSQVSRLKSCTAETFCWSMSRFPFEAVSKLLRQTIRLRRSSQLQKSQWEIRKYLYSKTCYQRKVLWRTGIKRMKTTPFIELFQTIFWTRNELMKIIFLCSCTEWFLSRKTIRLMFKDTKNFLHQKSKLLLLGWFKLIKGTFCWH